MGNKAILKGQGVVPIDDLFAWAWWIEKNLEARRVAETRLGAVRISTVFLGLNYGFGGSPLWFETMIFGGGMDGVQWRYATWDEAAKGHLMAVIEVREGDHKVNHD